MIGYMNTSSQLKQKLCGIEEKCPKVQGSPLYNFKHNLFYQLYAVSRALQVRQREPSAKTLRSPLSAEYLEALRAEWQNSMPGLFKHNHKAFLI